MAQLSPNYLLSQSKQYWIVLKAKASYTPGRYGATRCDTAFTWPIDPVDFIVTIHTHPAAIFAGPAEKVAAVRIAHGAIRAAPIRQV